MAATKGVEIVNYAQKFADAVKGVPGAGVISQPSRELYNMLPEDFSKQLEWTNIIVFGDVETKINLLLLHLLHYIKILHQAD